MEQANSEGVFTPDIYLKPDRPTCKCGSGKEITCLVSMKEGGWVMRCEECANEEFEKRKSG
jgi:hypothetical protein